MFCLATLYCLLNYSVKLLRQCRCLLYLCMNVHGSVSLRACVALCWASNNCCCCSPSAHSPNSQLFRRWPLSSCSSPLRRSLYLNTTHQWYIQRTLNWELQSSNIIITNFHPNTILLILSLLLFQARKALLHVTKATQNIC